MNGGGKAAGLGYKAELPGNALAPLTNVIFGAATRPRPLCSGDGSFAAPVGLSRSTVGYPERCFGHLTSSSRPVMIYYEPAGLPGWRDPGRESAASFLIENS